MAVTSLPGISSLVSGTTIKSSTSTSSTGSTSTSLPKLSSSATASGLPKLTTSGSSASSYATPTITPPSSDDNPFITSSNLPTDTVFIAVGAVAGLIFLSFIAFLFTRKIIARKTAKRTMALDSESSSDYNGNNLSSEKLTNPFYSTTNAGSTIKIPFLYEQQAADRSMADLTDPYIKQEQNFYSTLDREQDKRKSMFISPTAEVMKYNRNKSSKLIDQTINDGHSRESSNAFLSVPDLRHSRMESFDTNSDVRITSPERTPQRGRGHRTVPSAYLESMFEDD